MKTTLLTSMAGLALCAAASADDFYNAAAKWGPREMHQSAVMSTLELKAKFGQTAYESISSYVVEINSKATGAKVAINYTDGGTKKTASYFCHTHGSDIDCH